MTESLTPTPAPKGEKRLHIGRWVVLVLGGFGLYAWTWGPYGVVYQRQVDKRIIAMRHDNDSLRTLVHSLDGRLKRLQGDSTEIVLAARRAGLVRPGEILVRFVDTTAQ